MPSLAWKFDQCDYLCTLILRQGLLIKTQVKHHSNLTLPSQLWGHWHTLPLLTFSWIQKWIPLLCSEFFTHSLFPQFQEPAFSPVSVSICDGGEWRPLSGGNKKEIIFFSIIEFERYLFCLSTIHFHHWVVSHCIDYAMGLFTHHVLLGIWDIYIYLIILLLKNSIINVCEYICFCFSRVNM